MADAINPWTNFFNNFGNNDPDATDQEEMDVNGDVPEGDALDDAEQQLTDAQKAYQEYLDAEQTVVTKVTMTFAPIFKSFIDDAIKSQE